MQEVKPYLVIIHNGVAFKTGPPEFSVVESFKYAIWKEIFLYKYKAANDFVIRLHTLDDHE